MHIAHDAIIADGSVIQSQLLAPFDFGHRRALSAHVPQEVWGFPVQSGTPVPALESSGRKNRPRRRLRGRSNSAMSAASGACARHSARDGVLSHYPGQVFTVFSGSMDVVRDIACQLHGGAVRGSADHRGRRFFAFEDALGALCPRGL